MCKLRSFSTLTSLRKLLAQNREQGAEPASVVLYPGSELVPKCDLHAQPRDDHISNPVLAAAVDQRPFNWNPTAVCAHNLAADDGLAPGGTRADDPKAGPAILVEATAERSNGKIRVEPEELLLFLRRGAQPVATEGEHPDTGNIEILLHQASQASEAVGCQDVGCKRFDSLRAESGDECASILGGHGRPSRNHDDYGERQCCQATANGGPG